MLLAAISAAACTDRALAPAGTLDSVDGPPDGGAPPAPRAPGSLPAEYCERIIVLDDGGGLALFDPVALTFADSAALRCPASGTGAYSIALDRMGALWVADSGRQLYVADAQTGACTSVSALGDPSHHRFDMTFAPDGADESLFVLGASDDKHALFARVDPVTFALAPRGELDTGGELTSTEAGELWVLFRGAAPRVAQLDRATGAVTRELHVGAQLGDITGDGVAFSSFRGAFYVFLLPHNSSTAVYRMSPADGSAERVVSHSGRSIISATVARCLAP